MVLPFFGQNLCTVQRFVLLMNTGFLFASAKTTTVLFKHFLFRNNVIGNSSSYTGNRSNF